MDSLCRYCDQDRPDWGCFLSLWVPMSWFFISQWFQSSRLSCWSARCESFQAVDDWEFWEWEVFWVESGRKVLIEIWSFLLLQSSSLWRCIHTSDFWDWCLLNRSKVDKIDIRVEFRRCETSRCSEKKIMSKWYCGLNRLIVLFR